MDEGKIEFLIAQMKLGKITFADVSEKYRKAVTEKLDGDFNSFYKPTVSPIHQ